MTTIDTQRYRDLCALLADRTYVLEPANGSSRVEYELRANQPVPWTLTILRDGVVADLSDVMRQIAQRTPVGEWIAAYLREAGMRLCEQDTSRNAIDYSDRTRATSTMAYLHYELDCEEMSLLPIDVGFDLRLQEIAVRLPSAPWINVRYSLPSGRETSTTPVRREDAMRMLRDAGFVVDDQA